MHGAASPAASTAWLRFIKLSASRCHGGVGVDLAFLWCLLVCWHWALPAMPSVLGRSRDTSWFLPHGCDRAGGKTRAAGVQGSLSSCNIPHVKYEAKFLLILHEEPGVNCVLPISSSTELHSLCLHPQTASSRDISKSSSSAPCPNLKDSSSACSVHGLLGLGGQDKGSSGEDQAMRMMVFTTMVMVIECFCCWGQCCGGSASPSQVPAQVMCMRRVDETLCWAADLGRLERGPHFGPCPLQHHSFPPQPPKCCCTSSSGDLRILLVGTGCSYHQHLLCSRYQSCAGLGEPCRLAASTSAVPLAHGSFGP